MATQTPFEKFSGLIKHREDIADFKRRFPELLVRMLRAQGGAIFLIDLIVLSFVQKTLAALVAIEPLVNQWNYLIAGSVLRGQVEDLSKLYYILCVAGEDVEKICEGILKGRQFNHFKDVDGKDLTDGYLIRTANNHFPWVHSVYNETNQCVHLSQKHFFSIMTKMDSGHAEIELSGTLERWREEDVSELLSAVLKNAIGIYELVEARTKQKELSTTPSKK